MGTDVPEVVQTSYGYSFSYMSFIHWPANFPRLGGGAEEQEGASHHSGLILTWLLKTRQSRWSLDHKATGSTSSMIIGQKKSLQVLSIPQQRSEPRVSQQASEVVTLHCHM